jgi:hypothetical protein
MHDHFEQVYVVTRRQGDSLSLSSSRNVPVDSEGTRGLQRIKVYDNTTHFSSPGTLRKLAAIHIRYKQCGQYNYHHQAGVGGESNTNRKIQYPVYFVSEVLSDSKTRHFHIMKLTYTLLITSCKLSHYFQAHQIEVHTSSTLGEILNSREATGKIAKWVSELSMYAIVYKPRTTIKVQALSDFVAEWTETQTPPKDRELEYWIINFDGSLQLQSAGVGMLVTSRKGESFKYVLQIHFSASNNAAKYEALLHGLRIAMALGIR